MHKYINTDTKQIIKSYFPLEKLKPNIVPYCSDTINKKTLDILLSGKDDLLDGKSVIVLGRAPYLIENTPFEKQRELIDSFDIVFRINHPSPYDYPQNSWEHFVDPEYHDKLGTRTDILFANPETLTRFEKQEKYHNLFLEGGGKRIVSLLCTSQEIEPQDEKKLDVIKDHVVFLYDSMLKDIKSEYIDLGGGEPSSGAIAIAYCLATRCKSLYITGITAYRLRRDRHIYNDAKEKVGVYGTFPHNNDTEFDWLAKQRHKDLRVTFDKVMTQKFELERK